MSTLNAVNVHADIITATQTVAAGLSTGDVLTAAGGASGSSVVTLTATGVDTNVNINLVTKGTGALLVNGLPISGVSKVTLFYLSNRN